MCCRVFPSQRSWDPAENGQLGPRQRSHYQKWNTRSRAGATASGTLNSALSVGAKWRCLKSVLPGEEEEGKGRPGSPFLHPASLLTLLWLSFTMLDSLGIK